MTILIVMAVLFLAMWVFMIRPQKRRQQERARMLAEAGVGDEIVTAGGVYGIITDTADDWVVVEIAPETEIRVARNAIAQLVEPTDEYEEEDLEDEELDEELEVAQDSLREPEPADSAEPQRR